MGATATALGLPSEISHDGKVYRLAPHDNLEVTGFFEVWLARTAWEKLRLARSYMTNQEYAEQSKGLRTDLCSHVYDFGGEASLNAILSMAGSKHMTYLCMKKEQPEVEEEWVKETFWPAHQEEVLNHLFPGFDPNAKAPTKVDKPASGTQGATSPSAA